MRHILFRIPLLDWPIFGYGAMMVVAFLAAIWFAARRAKRTGFNPDHIYTLGLVSLISGIIGARVFFVVHYWTDFRDHLWSVFDVRGGGLEFYGGFITAVVAIMVYVWKKHLGVRRVLDLLAPSVALGLGFARIGCFLNGCCFGGPVDVAWAVRFPFASPAYVYQWEHGLVEPPKDLTRIGPDGKRIPLNRDQIQPRHEDLAAKHYALPVHPTQLYSMLSAWILAVILVLYSNRPKLRPGQIFAMLLMLYALTRFGLEWIRVDNPVELTGLTISQNIAVGTFILGLALWLIFRRSSCDKSLP